MGPYDEEINDERRVRLIKLIASQIRTGDKVESGFWAFVWLSHIDRLESFADEFSRSSLLFKQSTYREQRYVRALITWTARDREKSRAPRRDVASRSRSASPSKIPRPDTTRRAGPSSLSSPGASLIPTSPKTQTSATWHAESLQPKKFRRLATLPEKCRNRDQDRCLVTRGGDCIEVCHIYPFSLAAKMQSDSYQNFWDSLAFFWSEEQIRQWESKVLGPARTETLENVLCLAQTVHGLWGEGKFALKPISLSTDAKTLTVEFYWLDGYPHELKLLDTPPCSPESKNSTRRGTRLIDCQTIRVIESGDRLEFTTKDPKSLPLPSMEILGLQWILNRLVALSGAADVLDDELDPDNPFALAPPISVEDSEAEEEDGIWASEFLGSPAVPTAAVAETGENRPPVQSEPKGVETGEENPLALMTRGRNVF
ncbi:hypothetical protein BJX99DRAFT_254167 [Aspergillus californicus]